MERWRANRRVGRRAVLALALLAHAVLIIAMLRSRVSHERPDRDATLEAKILPAPTRRARVATALPPRPARLRSLAQPAPAPQAIHAPPLEPQPAAQAASAAEPAPSAASQPLNLTLTRDQIKALIAHDNPTLAQLAPHAAKASPYDRLAGEGDGMTLTELPHGVTEVHLHGQCYRLIPTPRAQSDPFNHANERLTGPCIGNF
jgi:hypothetical protein